MKNNLFNYLDLYSGIGGFKYALDDIGGKCIFSAEINKPAIKTYEFNHKDIEHSPEFSMDTFANLSKREIASMKEFKDKQVDLITAGFPCQTFSIAGKREGFNSDDTRGTQFFNVINLVNALKPKVVILENVKHLVNHDDGKTYKVIRETLIKANYNITLEKVISPLEVGVPQNRDRIFIVAVRKDISIKPNDIVLSNVDSKNLFQAKKSILDLPSQKYEGIELDSQQAIAIKSWESFVNLWLKNRDETERSIPAFWLDEVFEQTNPISSDMPEWKRSMIEKMISFRERHSSWIDGWYEKNKNKFSKRIYAKLEWNAGWEYKPRETIAVIRQSGVRFKKPNFYPALVAVVDIPIIFDQERKKWRNISFNEMKRLQSFKKLKKPDNVSYGDLFKQLGNSVNVEVVRRVVNTVEDILIS